MTGGLIIRPSAHLPPVRVWVRPGRVPSKAAGRVGTRRAWKRKHPPGWAIDPTRTASYEFNGILYVDPAAYERMKAIWVAAELKQASRNFGKVRRALDDLGLSAAQLGESARLFGVSASYVVTDDLDRRVHPDLEGNPDAASRDFLGMAKR